MAERAMTSKLFHMLLLSLVLSASSACAAGQSEHVVDMRKAAERAADTASSAFPDESYARAILHRKPTGVLKGAAVPRDYAVQRSGEAYSSLLDIEMHNKTHALLVWHDGALRMEKYFAPATSELRPESASMHKSVLALLFAAAIEDGFVKSVDDPIGRYIPEWSDDPRSDITLRDVLTMSSGLKPLSREGGVESASYAFIFDGAAARTTTLSQPLQTTPGAQFDYQNISSQLLLLVLERASGKPYAEYLSERLWRKLGAADAFLWLNEPDGFPRGYSSLLARAQDWLKVGMLIKDKGALNGEQIIAPALIEEATTPSAANPNYGWQIWLGTDYQPMRYYNAEKTSGFPASEPFLADDMIYFDGFGGQRVYISREKDLVIVHLGEIHMKWDDAALPNAVIRALPQ